MLGVGTAKLGHARIALEDQYSAVLLREGLGGIKRLGVTAQWTVKEPRKRDLV